MPLVDLLALVALVVLFAASFMVPILAIKLAPRRGAPVPDTEHLTVEQRRGLVRRFLCQPRFWAVSATAFALATAVTCAVYALPAKPGPVLLATMLGLPYVFAVSAVLYVVQPIWHCTVTGELRRLGELRNCPACGYDLAELSGSVCPECGGGV